MFDILDNIRDAWNENRFVFLLNTKGEHEIVTAVLPSQLFQYAHFQRLREFQTTDPSVTLTYQFCKTLELPYMNTIFRAVSSRYPIVDNLLPYQSGASISESAYSLSVDHISTEEGSSYKEMEITIQSIGDLVDRANSELKMNEVRKEFGSTFRIPGHVRLIRSSLGGMRQKISTTELSLALCEVAKFSTSTVNADLIDVKSGNFLNHNKGLSLAEASGIATIDAKTVIDLWRSIFKVPKNELESM